MKVRMLLAAVAAAGVCIAPALAQPTGTGKPGATPATPAQPSKPTTGQPVKPEVKPGEKTPGNLPPGMPSPEEMVNASKPGAEHQQLQQQFEGAWDTVVTCTGPDGQDVTTKGTSHNKMVLGGRYLSQHFSGTMAMPGMGEMPFEGMGITGYDKAKSQWFGTWVDSMGTGLMSSTGTYDSSTKTYTFKGSYDDPTMGHMDIREVIRVESPDRHVMEFYMPAGPGGPEVKSMTITYTRSRGGAESAPGRSNAPTTAPGNSGNAPGHTTTPGSAPKTGGRP